MVVCRLGVATSIYYPVHIMQNLQGDDEWKKRQGGISPILPDFRGCPSGGFPRRGRGLVALREKENPELHQLGAGSGWERMGVRLIVRPAGARPS